MSQPDPAPAPRVPSEADVEKARASLRAKPGVMEVFADAIAAETPAERLAPRLRRQVEAGRLDPASVAEALGPELLVRALGPEILAAAIEAASSEHRIQREMTFERVREAVRAHRAAQSVSPDAPVGPVREGLYLDTETTGLDPAGDKIIQFAALPFRFDRAGILDFAPEASSWFQDPGEPLKEEVVKLTGITDEMVAGRSLDFAAIGAMVRKATICVPHNAAFDRPFCERIGNPELEALFRARPWLCSQSQVDWSARGMSSSKLGHISLESGWFFGAHRADADCLAGIAALLSPPAAGAPEGSLAAKYDAFGEMARTGARPTCRIWAVDSPFESKDVLKERGYRWDGDALAGFKSWWRDVEGGEALLEEKRWLSSEVYPARGGRIGVRPLNALNRFSARAWKPERHESLVRADIEAAIRKIQGEGDAPEAPQEPAGRPDAGRQPSDGAPAPGP